METTIKTRLFPTDAGIGLGGASFAICLPSTVAVSGVAFFWSGPYDLTPPTPFDASTILSYPRNPSAYSIQLRGIAVNQEEVRLPAPGSLDRGGGVTLGTAAPYTVMRSDEYRPLVAAFEKATALVPRMPSVSPFEVCFDSSALGFTRVGHAVAPVDLMTRGGGNWTVFGSNSLAQVTPDTACLAFVDGGWAAASTVAVGGFQMENNLLLFDEGRPRAGWGSAVQGYTGTLLFIVTTCGNFNFSPEIN